MPNLAETLYRNGLFKFYRQTWGYLTEIVAYPFVVILLLILAYGIGRFVLRSFREKKLNVLSLLNVMGVLICWFFVSWGWNYSCPGIQEKQPVKLESTTPDYLQLAALAAEQAGILRNRLPYMTVWHSDSAYFEKVHPLVKNELTKFGFAPRGFGKVKLLRGNGFMRKLGIAGIYFPFAGEGYTDLTYMAPERNFILAHECAHVYGITDEGEANLVAFLALVNSGDDALAYAGWIELLRYLVPRGSPHEFADLIPEVVASDIQMLRDQKELFVGYFPWVSIQLNNAYLHAMGVEDGIESYAFFPDLVALYIQRIE